MIRNILLSQLGSIWTSFEMSLSEKAIYPPPPNYTLQEAMASTKTKLEMTSIKTQPKDFKCIDLFDIIEFYST